MNIFLVSYMASTTVQEVSEGLYVLRVNDDRTKFFEGLWEIPEGITYNAYILTLPEKTVLIDGWKKDFTEEFIASLSRITSVRDIDYVVVNHMEPDHSGTLAKVLELNGGRATVLSHPFSKGLIESLLGIRPKFRAVKDGEIIDLGKERMKFIYTPWLHWPETIITYLEERSVLLSCDAFGGYSIPPTVFDDDLVIPKYLPHVRKYFANVIGHYRDFVAKAIEKIKALGINPRIVAPAHGIIWRKNPSLIIEYYNELARGRTEKGKIVVIYTSMYGYVEMAIDIAVNYMRSKGLKPVIFRFTDRNRDGVANLIGEVEDAEAIIIGTSAYEAEIYPLMKFLTDLIIWKSRRGRPVLIVSTYGWGNIVARGLGKVFKDSGFENVITVSIKGMSSQKDIELIKEAAEKLLNILSAGNRK